MGFRFRKSIKIGGGFRVNLSKSGVGYSWGTKGFRYTKKASGGSRTTYSLYGTGLSYVDETGKGRKMNNSGSGVHQEREVQTYDEQDITNAVATEMVSEGLEDMLAMAAGKLRILRLLKFVSICSPILLGYLMNWGIKQNIDWAIALGFLGIAFVSLPLIIYSLHYYFGKSKRIYLDYTIDEDVKDRVLGNLDQFIKITHCNKVWRLVQSGKVANTKYSSGASELAKRVECKTSKKAPFPFYTTEKVAVFKMPGNSPTVQNGANANETLLFLPDKLFIMQGWRIGAVNYEDIEFDAFIIKSIETGEVPKDTVVAEYTWYHTNKSGGPDRRFANNPKIPVCKYGEMTLKSSLGIDTALLFSNPNTFRDEND